MSLASNDKKTATKSGTKSGTSGGKGGGFTGTNSDMGPTVSLPEHLMPFQPTTMFA